MIHVDKHPLARKKVRIKAGVKHPQFESFGGTTYEIEDWWDRLTGGSWMDAKGNPACLIYAVRVGFNGLPTDDEVVYGYTDNGLGHLVHITEIEEVPNAKQKVG